LIDGAGSITASYGYDAYGEKDAGLSAGDPEDNNPLNPYRYSARRFDSGSGTIDMGARRFGPDTGRFLQPDLFLGALDNLSVSTDPLTGNRYSLAGGNPLSFIEWDGHLLVADGGGGSAPSPNPTGGKPLPTYTSEREGGPYAEEPPPSPLRFEPTRPVKQIPEQAPLLLFNCLTDTVDTYRIADRRVLEVPALCGALQIGRERPAPPPLTGAVRGPAGLCPEIVGSLAIEISCPSDGILLAKERPPRPVIEPPPNPLPELNPNTGLPYFPRFQSGARKWLLAIVLGAVVAKLIHEFFSDSPDDPPRPRQTCPNPDGCIIAPGA
jgi:RHS repeat-associated protein